MALRQGGTAQAACDTLMEDIYYLPPNSTFALSTSLYLDSDGTSAPAGYYSNGISVRYWDGVSFTTNANCGNPNQEL